MRAIHLAKPRKLERIEIAEPGKPGLGEVLVKSHCMGVCGTDISSYLGTFPFFDYPRIPGHELGVEVLEIGPGVTQLSPGDRCAVEPYLNCGRCYPCRKGAFNCCESLNVIGVMSDGGLRERFLFPARKLHPSSHLSYRQLALVETLAIGCHASQRTAFLPEDQILIIGAGPIGLSALEFIKLCSARITMMDREESRLQFCRDHYAMAHTIHFRGDGSELEQCRAITGGDRYQVVVDATGNHHSMSAALNYVAATGTLIYLGVTAKEISFQHALLHRPEINIKGSRNALPGDFKLCLSLIESGEIDTRPWISRELSFDEVITGFDRLTNPASGVLKALIHL